MILCILQLFYRGFNEKDIFLSERKMNVKGHLIGFCKDFLHFFLFKNVLNTRCTQISRQLLLLEQFLPKGSEFLHDSKK